jgi:hypothetical protein
MGKDQEMIEDEVERRIKRLVGVLDRALLRGDIDQLIYDQEIARIVNGLALQHDSSWIKPETFTLPPQQE